MSLVYWLLRRRLRYSWGLLILTSFGILAAVTLMSTGAMYSRVLGEAGLRHSLASFSPQVLNAQIIAQNRPLDPADYRPLSEAVEETSELRVGHLQRGIERFGRVQTGLPSSNRPVRVRSADGPSGRPFFMTGFQDHSHLTQGDWPQTPGIAGPEGVEIDAVMGARAARTLGIQLGSQVYVWPFQGFSRGSSIERIALNIVGLAEPNDPSEEYWMGALNQFSVQVVGEQVEVLFYLTEEDFFGVLGTRFPTLVGDFGFSLFLDSTLVTAETASATQEAMAGLETDLNKQYPRTLVLSRLSLTLDEFQQELTLARVPLYVFISLFVAVIVYFLVMITGVLGRSQAEEAGLLRSRGASLVQVGGVLALAEGVVAVIAVVIGPFLAWLIVRHLLLPTIVIPGGGNVPSGLSADMFWMGAAGGGLAVIVLVATAMGRARQAMVESLSSRARPPSVPFLHRYYIDILAVLVVGLIWWQVRGRDGFVAEELAERGVAVDPTLILGPVLGLFAAAVLLMRVLPMGVRLLAWAGARSSSAWLTLSLVRLARDPIPHGSLAVMLMLAAALGVFGATFQSSLSNSQRQQALHRVGGDLVVRGPLLDAESAAQVASVAGVQAVTPVLLDSARLLDIDPGESATLMAAEPTALAQASWFRDDFAGRSLSDLVALLRSQQPGVRVTGVPLPENADRLGLWVDVSDPDGQDSLLSVNVWARLVDARGQYRSVSLGSIGDSPISNVDGWRFLEGELPAAISAGARPLELVSVFLSSSSFSRVTAASVRIDDVTAIAGSRATDRTVIEGFEAPSNWQPLANREPVADTVAVAREGARSGDLGLTFSWEEPLAGGQRGVHLPPGPLPLPAIGGPTFQPGQDVRIEHERMAIPLRIVATTQHFPTVSTSRRPFLLLDLNHYEEYLALLPAGAFDQPDQLWVALDLAADRQQAIAAVSAQLPTLHSVVDREEVAKLAESNPLAGGGWDGLTALGMTAIGLAVVLTLSVFAAVSVRTGRTDLAVGRALGFSRNQFLLSVLVERLVIAAVAIAAGGAIGYWPGLELVEMMDLTPRGLPAVPPLVPAVQAWLLAVVLAGLGAATVASVLFTVVQARRLNTAETLRESG